MKPATQFITSSSGRKIAVVIPVGEYEQLMEDVADLVAVAERRNDERIPLAEVKQRLEADGLLPKC